MSSPQPNAKLSAPVQLRGGGRAELTLEAVGRAALFVVPAVSGVEVFAELNGRLVPALQLVREALDGPEPLNTHAAEVALHELGFRILASRRFDTTTGKPVALNMERRGESER